MKILLRNFGGNQYVWKTAKYHNDHFYVNGEQVNETSIVSIVNDNRKNYVQCSSCGEVFKKGSAKFHEHRANAIKPETCFNCCHMTIDYMNSLHRTFKRDEDGGYIQKSEDLVILRCANSGSWHDYDIESVEAINNCKKRQCANATEMEIEDFFTRYPGVFDDILTMDVLLDSGCNIPNIMGYGDSYDIESCDNYILGAYINRLGIVDMFYAWYNGDKYWMYYSKKYDMLFKARRNKYVPIEPWDIPTGVLNEIKNKIAKFYR